MAVFRVPLVSPASAEVFLWHEMSVRSYGVVRAGSRAQACKGKADSRPQVIWPNGVLASTAVCLALDLVTKWTRQRRRYAYLVYGRQRIQREGKRDGANPHSWYPSPFPDGDVGGPVLGAPVDPPRAGGSYIRSAQKRSLGGSI